MMSKPFLVIVFFIFTSIFVGHFFLSELFWGQKDLFKKKLGQTKFGLEIVLGEKNLGQNFFKVKKIWA